MAVCLRCALPNRSGSPANDISTHNSRLPVRWGRAPPMPAARRNGSAPPISTLSAKKYNFNEQVKVCQDNPEGILCYRNEDGEVVCEGYDEGPRFRPAAGQRQKEQYRKDADLYSIIPGVRLYLVEGIDYTSIMDQSLMGFFSSRGR